MKINIVLNSKELATLIGDIKDPISYDFEIDIYTESQKTITKKQETAIFAGLFWALCTMLPHVIIAQVFKKWNAIVKDLQEGLQERAAEVKVNTINQQSNNDPQ
jgi:hypothetical protein